MLMAVNQADKFYSNLKAIHNTEVTCIGKCLLTTANKGLKIELDPSKSLEFFADSDFAGAYNYDATEDLESI